MKSSVSMNASSIAHSVKDLHIKQNNSYLHDLTPVRIEGKGFTPTAVHVHCMCGQL